MSLPSFHEILFPEAISYGSSGGPGFNTTVIELASGAEQRNINWSQARATYDVSHGVKTREQMEEILEFFWARRGKAYGFRFKDWMDFQLPKTLVGIADGSGFIKQVYKRYESDTDFYYDRAITKFAPGYTLYYDDTVINPVYLNPNTGIVTLAGGQTPTAGTHIYVEGEFHVPVRFDTDEIKISHDDWELMSWPSIPLVELKASTL